MRGQTVDGPNFGEHGAVSQAESNAQHPRSHLQEGQVKGHLGLPYHGGQVGVACSRQAVHSDGISSHGSPWQRTYLAEGGEVFLGDVSAVQSLQKDAAEADHAAHQHRVIHVRLRQLDIPGMDKGTVTFSWP